MPRPGLASGIVAVLSFASTALGQDPMRPWLPWRTLETRNYRFHFLPQYERWTIDAASRVESIDSALVAMVGSAPPRPVDIVVHDPFANPNGYVLPFLEQPASVWWVTPPGPRVAFGQYRSWGEMLAAHELGHLTHLTRPSRNPAARLLASLLPTRLGPVAIKSPRWVIEGYATVLEGRITGLGRPNGAWRPAILRQWAVEGRLPSYPELSSSTAFHGGDFAYLNGSAFLEWLLRREGDSSLVHVWRRMSARTLRSFDRSFAGVYGEAPSVLYRRHAAEITGDAMRAKAALEQAGLREGELFQRLAWESGDPAVSANGDLVAITLRERNRPPRLVIWRTGPDSAPPQAARRRPRAPRPVRDSLDVPDRAFFPPTKRPVATLEALNGAAYLYPRWFADNKRVLVTRWTQRGDGTSGPDLYVWSVNGTVRRLTDGEDLLHADPSPDSREAVAMRCREGHCDVVRVYFATNLVQVLLQGTAQRSYYRPRFSADGSRFAAAVSDSGRWRIVVADRDGRNARYVDPDDNANRYDVQWLGGEPGADTLLVVSDRGGVPNLETLSLATGAARSVTRVTGAAVAPDVNRQDRSIWFLSLHSRGLDVRRLASDAARADSVVVIDAGRFGFAGAGRGPGTTLATKSVSESAPYRLGPSQTRWLPALSTSTDGAAGYLALHRTDMVGRLSTLLSVGYGERGTWRGAALRVVGRFRRPTIELGVHTFEHNPSEGRWALALSDSLDARGLQAVVALSRDRRGETWRVGLRAGVAGGPVASRLEQSRPRVLGFTDIDLQGRQVEGARGVAARFRVRAARGTLRAPFWRTLVSASVGSAGGGILPFEFGATIGAMRGSRHPFEEFTIGGAPQPTMDSSVMTQRFPLPLMPTGGISGRSLTAWRIAFPFRWTLYADGVQVSSTPFKNLDWHRVIGIESRFGMAAVPVAASPAMQVRTGVGMSVDRPFRRRFGAYVTMRLEP